MAVDPKDPKNARPPFLQAILAKLAASRFLTTSLVIHIALITLLGSVVIFKAAQQQDAFVASVGTDGILSESAEPASEAAETPQEFEEPSAPSTSEPSAVSQASAIQSLTEGGSFTISAPSDTQMMGNTLSMTDRMTSNAVGNGGRTGGAGGGSGGKLSGSLFGVKIETKKLGVMVDVSGSAHPFLLGALMEVEQSFKGMPTVLVFGCGAKKSVKSSDFAIKGALQADKDYAKQLEILSSKPAEAQRKAAEETVYGQVAKASLTPGTKALGQYFDRMQKQANVYWSVSDKGENPRFGADHVMKFLADQDVDTIYWFSDCNDVFEIPAAEEIAKKLKAKGIRVIAHNFTGLDDPKVNPGVPAAKKIVEETGGQYISKKIPTAK